MVASRNSQNGQLLLPMLVLMLLFGTFLAGYIRWCRQVYWQMRMDIAAEAVALSVARAQAEMLNNIATSQTLGNVLFQKVPAGPMEFATVQASQAGTFHEYRMGLKVALRGYPGYAMLVANQIATKNGATDIPIPFPPPKSYLVPRSVWIIYMAGYIPSPAHYTENVYYARGWGHKKANAQPVHKNAWAVTRDGIVGVASARLWLDIDSRDPLANGGFPPTDPSIWRGLGVQCFYPHFNGRLSPTSLSLSTTLRTLAKAASS